MLLGFAVALTACGPTAPGIGAETDIGTARHPSEEAGCTGVASETVRGTLRRVSMRVEPCRVDPGQTPKMLMKNAGEATVGYGPGFKLERRTGDRWRWVNRRQAFPMPLFYLEPGETDREPIAVYRSSPEPKKLAPGLYRVSKGIQLTPGRMRPPTMVVRATFRVAP